MSLPFNNQAVLVTGGSTGIGAAIARELAEAGARVLITGRTEGTLASSAAQNARIEFVVADVSRPADAAGSVEEAKRRFGRLDVLVNNAGILQLAPLEAATPEHVRTTLATNLEGTIETTRAALPLLRQSQGNVVNLSSIAADQPFPGMSVYAATKAAILALTRSWAQELAPARIRVNAVSPGPVATPMFTREKLQLTAKELDQMGAAFMSQLPIKRLGEPREIARVVAFLASKQSGWVTGAQYTIAGGLEA